MARLAADHSTESSYETCGLADPKATAAIAAVVVQGPPIP